MLFDLHADTKRLAVLRSDPDGGHKIELRTLQGQMLGEITAEFLPLGPQWSPNGSIVAFGSNDGLLYLHRLGDASPTVVFAHPSLQAGFCEWAADGNRLVFSAYNKVLQTPPGIYCLELDTGHTLQLTNDAKTVDRFPHPSPSGQWVAFQRQFLDEPELPRRVYVIEVQSGQCFPVLNAFEGDVDTGRFSWSPDSSSLLVKQAHQGRIRLSVIRLEDKSITWSYESETVQGGVFSPQGDRILCICSDELLWFAYPEGTLLHRLSLASAAPVWNYFTGPQIGFDLRATIVYFVGANNCLYRWRIGGNCDCILEDSPPVRPAFTHEEYRVPSRDGRPIPVQRFIPPQPRSAAILYVHGGPGGSIDPDDPFMLRLLSEGVEFVCAAYRGSSGYGPKHEDANRGEYGRADVWDILAAGYDWKKRAGEDRPLILAGYSYGGFLTFLALAQEDIPWVSGIAMWTLSGMHRQPLHRHRAFPVDADQQAAAWVERSPLEQAGRIRVPLLIFHGALDTTATTEELKSIQASILTRGGECELIVFDDDTHGLMRHRDEIHARVLRFLRQFE
ncbi:MAG: S9 family peptidase [Chloroflexi bacterium]|nr:MAG: S9 family peptidase [Chloroflexota bacterium]